MRIVISILSDQLIPNVLFIKQMGEKGDIHIFLSSKEMEQKHKSRILAQSLNLGDKQYRTIVIDQNSPSLILQVLEKEFPKEKQHSNLVINITGGTKMMSQMAHFYFRGFDKTTIYYWPIGEKYVEQLHPEFKRIEIENPVQLNLKTYLAAHGYSFTQAERPDRDYHAAEELYRKVITYGDAALVSEISKATNTEYKENDKGYLSGGWFEVWLYFTLKKELQLKDSQIGLNLKIKNEASKRGSESDNELDVAFVYKNTLYILECKVYTRKQLTGKRITDAIYKISSVRQSLGLKAAAMVFILSPFGNSRGRRNTTNDLVRMANVKQVFSLEDLKRRETFLNKIKMMIDYE